MTSDLTRKPMPATSSASSVVAAPTRKRRAIGVHGWVLSAPALLLLAVFLFVPFCMAVYLSFTNNRLGSPLPTRWVGWDNYRHLFADSAFLQALRNNILFALIIVPVQTAIALGLALLVNQRIRAVAFFRAVFFAPVVMGIAVASTVWYLLFDPAQGLLNGLLKVLSWGHLHSGWLESPRMALPAIMILSVWASVGFQMVILLAGLQDVPGDLYEAAEVDGANGWQQFLAITLPGLRNVLIFVVTMTTIFAFRLFDQVYILTSGGPLGHTDTLLLQLFRVGYERQQIGRACAIAVLFFCVVVVFTAVQRLVLREDKS